MQVYVVQRITRHTSATATHVALNKDTALQLLEEMINSVCHMLHYDEVDSVNADRYRVIKEALDNRDIVSAYFELNATSFIDATGNLSKCPYKINFLSIEPADDIMEEKVKTNISSVITRVETPCKVCKRMNDVGAKVCWNCGNHP